MIVEEQLVPVFRMLYLQTHGRDIIIITPSAQILLRGHNWVYFAIGHSVLLPWI